MAVSTDMSACRSVAVPVVAVILLATMACTAGAAPSLEGRRFLSTAVTVGGADRPLVPGTRITLGFADGQLSASVGCNTMGASYRVDGGRLVIGQAFQTEMGCDPERMAQDEWLFGFLGSGPVARLSSDELVLEGGGTVIRLLDREIAEPDLPLVGPTWTLVSIIEGDAVSSVPEGVVATLRFGADGRVAIQTGCNEGGATFTVADGTLRLGDIITTKRACVGAGTAVEEAVLAVLGQATAVGIDASSLELRSGGRGLQFSGA